MTVIKTWCAPIKAQVVTTILDEREIFSVTNGITKKGHEGVTNGSLEADGAARVVLAAAQLDQGVDGHLGAGRAEAQGGLGLGHGERAAGAAGRGPAASGWSRWGGAG